MLSIIALVHIAAIGNHGQMPSGADLFKRSQAAYDAVKTLQEDGVGTIEGHSGTAHIVFQRPGKLRVSGNSLFGSKYELVCDGKASWVFNVDSWSQVQSPEIGIASITGVSGNAGTAVPAVLFHAPWGGLTALKGTLKVSKQAVGGHACYRIDSSTPLPMSIWLDAKTSLIVQTKMDAMGHYIVVKFSTPVINRPVPASAFKR